MSLLPNNFRIRDDMPMLLERVEAPAADGVRYVPVCDWTCAQASDRPPRLVRLHLTEEAEAEADDFRRVQKDRGCVCFTGCAPCGWCTHPGNPLNLGEDDEAWVMGFEEAES